MLQHRFSLVVFLWTCALILAGSIQKADASFTFGAFYEASSDTAELRSDLNLFQSSGISRLIITNEINYNQAEVLSDFEFDISIFSGFEFKTLNGLKEHSLPEILANRLSPFIDAEVDVQNILGSKYSVLHNAATVNWFTEQQQVLAGTPFFHLHSMRYVGEFALAESLQLLLSVRSYEDYNRSLLPLADLGIAYFPDSDSLHIRDFQNILTESRIQGYFPVYFDANQALDFQNVHLDFFEVLKAFHEDSATVFPNPAMADAPKMLQSLLAGLFIILWASYGLHALLNPAYLGGFLRYIYTHNFFVADIIERRIRYGATNYFILIQSSLMGGILAFLFYKLRLSPEGMLALSYHFGLEQAISGFTVFFVSFVFITIINLIFIAWLYFSHPEIKFFNQSAVLHLWPQHLLVLLTSFALLVVLREGSYFWIDVSTALFLGMICISFLYAASDALRFIPSTQSSFLIYIFGGFVLVFSLFLGWFFSFSEWWQIFQLIRAL